MLDQRRCATHEGNEAVGERLVVVQLGERTRAVLVDVEHGCSRAAVCHGEIGADVMRRDCAGRGGEGKVEQALHLLLPAASAVQHRRARRAAARRVSRGTLRVVSSRVRVRVCTVSVSATPALRAQPTAHGRASHRKRHHAGEMDKDGI